MARVLIVDSDETNRTVLARLLSRQGHDALEAGDGAEALALARRVPPDLVIAEVLMPGMDGFLLCRDWLSTPELRSIPFLLCSSVYTDESDVEFALAAGAAGLIDTAQAPARICAQVERHLERRIPVVPHPPVLDEEAFKARHEHVLRQKLRDKLVQLEAMNRALDAGRRDFEQMFRANPMPMWIYDLETLRFLAVNDAAVGTYGYVRDEWLGMTIKDIRPEEDVPRLLEQVDRDRDETYSPAQVWRHRRKDGSLMQVEVSAHSMPFQGRPARVVSVLDVTERRRLEAAMEQSEARYRALFENNHAAMLVIDPETTAIVDANPAAAGFYGYTREHLRQMRIGDINILSPAEIRAQMELARAARKQFFEFRHRLASGEVRNVEVYSGLVQVAGRPLLYSIVHDVTRRHEAEQELRDAEMRFRALVEHSVFGTYILEDGCFSYTSPSMEAMLGCDPGFLRGKPALAIVAPEDQALVAEHIRRRADGELESVRYQFRGAHAAGRPLILEVHGAVATIKGRRVIIGVAQDVTEKVSAAERERKYAGEVRAALRGIIDVLGQMVEMRDPFTAGHHRQVALLATAIARELGIAEERLQGLGLAASIFDLGKIAIPADLLSKPGRLSDVERQFMRLHVTAGHELLKNVAFPWPLAEIVLQHHERMDGSGYPRGLCGEAILLEARILGVADTVTAMVSHRPYRPARPVEEALSHIEANAGTLYDKAVVSACLQLVRDRDFELVP